MLNDNIVNTDHDVASHEKCNYQRGVVDGNVLYDAFLKMMKASGWKTRAQQFEMNYLLELGSIQNDVSDGTFEFSDSSELVIYERGKPRVISSESPKDKTVKHAICDEVLNPSIRKYLIYDNGASLKGKGTKFTRDRLVAHLSKYYREHGSNEGWILLIDFSKYFDNIRHDHMLYLFRKYVKDETTLHLLEQILNKSRVDVSYMSDEEYEHCLDEKFDVLKHHYIDESLLTGEKYMDKHMNLGDQVSQTAGVAYHIFIDNYVKNVAGAKYYAIYNDDAYIIHEDKQFLMDLYDDIVAISKVMGIIINTHKVRICKLSGKWRFLQVQYSLNESGRITQKINPKKLTAMRRKMKKMSHVMTQRELINWFNSWYESNKRYLSKKQKYHLKTLLRQLLNSYNIEGGNDSCSQSHLQMDQ